MEKLQDIDKAAREFSRKAEETFWEEAEQLLLNQDEKRVRCAYDRGAKPEPGYWANSFCRWCNLPLCKACGYSPEGMKLCNDCYSVYEKQK